MAKIYKIYPPLGFPRVGNLDLTAKNYYHNIYFNLGNNIYKEGGKVIPRETKFQIWEHDLDSFNRIIDSRPINLNSTNVEILEWSVKLANKKAGFFKFGGKAGLNALNGKGYRNTNPNKWIMDPPAVKISGKNIRQVRIIHKKDSSAKKIPTTLLGELWTTGDGDLEVTGGKGIAKSTSGAAIGEYANNATWYDDVSDGPVNAILKFKGQAPVPVMPAWVIVGPPDFAPEIEGTVTLYDALLDMMIQQNPGQSVILENLRHYGNAAEMYKKLSTYIPNFYDDILPILERGNRYRYVSAMANVHSPWKIDPAMPQTERERIFLKMRDPNTGKGGSMPMLHGDGYGTSDLDKLLSLTKTQYDLMEKWKDNKFTKTPATVLKEPFTSTVAILKSISGGAFYPGIEVGWQILQPKIFSEPFRVDPAATDRYKAAGYTAGKLEAGHFTRQMAVPWQADFTDCEMDDAGWWPSQRPDDILGSASKKWFERIKDSVIADRDKRHAADRLVMTKKWGERSFIVSDGKGGFKEQT